jgi:hypothetical protein
MHAVTQNSVLFLCLVGLRLLKSQILRARDFISKQIIMKLELPVHLEVICLLLIHQCGLKLIDKGLFTQYPLLEPQDVMIGALLINLRVLITIDSIDSQLA